MKSNGPAQGETPLFIATRNKCIETMEALIKAKAKIDERNKKVIHFVCAIFVSHERVTLSLPVVPLRVDIQGHSHTWSGEI